MYPDWQEDRDRTAIEALLAMLLPMAFGLTLLAYVVSLFD